MFWATLEEARTITGRSEITDAQVAAAQSTIEIFSNRSPEASGAMASRDLYWLRAAVSWQAAWLSGQVAVDQRQGVKFAMQDGQSYNPTDPTSVVLAPLAARALKNCSWIGTRTLLVPPSSVGDRPAMLDFPNDYGDEGSDWQPMEGFD